MGHGMDTRVKYIIYCDDFHMAAKYAAERDWHLSWWRHFTDEYAPGRPICYERNFQNEWLDIEDTV